MFRRTVLLLAFLLGVVLGLAARTGVSDAQAASCGFSLGFKTLHDMIPDIVGDCRENEWHNAQNGDGLQQTTGGLLVWRKFDNWTAFTNGSITWINGPFGLQARANTEQFPWEGVGSVPSPSSPGGSAPTSNDSQIQSSSTTAPPSLTLRISDIRPDNMEEFTIRLDASSDVGIQSVWWWATSTDDDDLRDTHSANCRASNPCRRTWDVSTPDWGRIIIHAKTRDENGIESEELTHDVRVREPAPTATPTSASSPTATLTPTATATTAPPTATASATATATATATHSATPTATVTNTSVSSNTEGAAQAPTRACTASQQIALNVPVPVSGGIGFPYSVGVTSSAGAGCAGKIVHLDIQSGPNTGLVVATQPLDGTGVATLSYTGAVAGIDTYVVWLDVNGNAQRDSTEPQVGGTVTWASATPTPIPSS